MPIIRIKFEEAVNRVLKRLTKAKESASEPVTDDGTKIQMASKIENYLQNIHPLPPVKSIEEDLIKRFITLEKEMGHDIFEDREKFYRIVEMLRQISEDIQSVKKHISVVEVRPKDATNSTSVRNNVPPKGTQPRIASREWSRLITEEALFKSEAIQSLLRSFNALDYNSQLCLLSFSIFPEKCEINKRMMIYWWIAEGFISSNKYGDTADDIGNSIFRDLINGRLIKAVDGKRSPIVGSCTVHPWIRRMLISLARKAQLFDFDTMGVPTNSQQRLFMSGNQDGLDSEGESLVSVFNMDQEYLRFKADSLSRWKSIVVLVLGRWQIDARHHIEIQNEDLLKGLRALKHLRYLSLRGISRVFALPRSLSELVSLEILDLRACHNLEKLPSAISSLTNLTHLDISECFLLENMPNGLEKLTKLQVLKGFVVGNTSKPSCKISNLTGFRKLRKLGLYIRTKAAVEEQEFMKLAEIRSLRNLTISWGEFSLSSNQNDMVKSILLPPRLNKLDLRCIPAETLPEWVDLKKLGALEKLYIRGGKLKSLGYLESDEFSESSIKIFRLKYLKDLIVREEQLKSMFPRAVYLDATKCQGADVFWNKDEEKTIAISF